MPITTETIRRITIEGRQSGLTETTDALNDLTAAQGRVAAASSATATVTDTSAKKQLSAAEAYRRQTLSLDENARMTDKVARATKVLDSALAQGVLGDPKSAAAQGEYAKRLSLINDKYGEAGVASRALAMEAQALAGRLGPVGSLVAAIGPAGLLAAAGLGAGLLVMGQMSSAAHVFAADMLKLRDGAETLDLTTRQLQALNSEGVKFALPEDQIAAVMRRFNAQMVDLREGHGELFNLVRGINPELAKEMNQSRGTANAILFLAEAYKQAGDQRAKLDRIISGKAGGNIGLLVQEVDRQGGLDLIAAQTSNLRDQIDPKLIDAVSKLEREIATMSGDARRNFASIFSEQVLTAEKEFVGGILELSRALKDIKDGNYGDALRSIFNVKVEIAPNSILGLIFGGQKLEPITLPVRMPVVPEGGTLFEQNPYGRIGKQDAPDRSTLQTAVNEQRALVSALGSAADATERLTLRQRELDLALKDKVIDQEKYKRAMGVAELEKAIQLESARLGVLGESAPIEETVLQRRMQIDLLQRQGIVFTEREIANAARLSRERALGTDAMKQQADAFAIEAATVGLATGAATAYRLEQTRIQQARRTGQPLTAFDIESLKKEAAAAGVAAQALARTQIQDKIRFDRATMFLTDDDIRIAEALKTIYGKDIPAALASSEAASMRFTASMRELNNIGLETTLGLMSDFRNGLRQGQNAWDSFQNAGLNALNKISDKLMDMALKQVWATPFGGASNSLPFKKIEVFNKRESQNERAQRLEVSARGNHRDRWCGV